MRDVLCIYYSRTGNTKRVMETIAKEMDAELLALTDGVERSGLRGWLRSGMDAMRKDCPDVLPFETERKLENYHRRHPCVGGPVQQRGAQLSEAARQGTEPGGLCADPGQRTQM